MNLFHAQLYKHENGTFTIKIGDQGLIINPPIAKQYQNLQSYCHQPLIAGLRPEAFSLPETLAVDRIRVEVISLEVLGHEQLIYARVPGFKSQSSDAHEKQISSILIARVPSSRVHPGNTLDLGVDMSKLYLFTEDGKALPLN